MDLLLLQVTERGRHADQDSPFHGERWLLASSRENQVVIFASDQDITTIFSSQHIIMDGTFKVAPDGFAQLYTIHVWGAHGHEASPVIHALMRSKNIAAYVFLFERIRQKLQENHGGLGALSEVHMDYELAAHQAMRQIFPEIRLRGCNFHFSQALNRKLQQLGLRRIWNDDGVNGEWIGCLKALAMLPPFLIRPAFQTIMGNPPAQENGRLDEQFLTFRQYFENTWLNGQFPVEIWSQYDNTGPRTTNHAEGYHNRLNMADMRDMHLALRNFLHLLQPLHNRDQIRVRNLQRGVFQPKQRDPTYAELDNRINLARNQIFQATGHLWGDQNINVYQLPPPDFQLLMREIHMYLRHMRHLVGKKSRVVLNEN